MALRAVYDEHWGAASAEPLGRSRASPRRWACDQRAWHDRSFDGDHGHVHRLDMEMGSDAYRLRELSQERYRTFPPECAWNPSIEANAAPRLALKPVLRSIAPQHPTSARASTGRGRHWGCFSRPPGASRLRRKSRVDGRASGCPKFLGVREGRKPTPLRGNYV